jgi:Tol biopolymer transport system component
VRVWLALLGTLPLLAVGSGATASPSAPPQNGLIAVQGSEGISIIDPRTDTVSLVPRSLELADPAWSPDGSLLAVTVFEMDRFDVYTMKPDGGDRTLVLRNASQPSWSPDGKRLVVLREACAGGLTCDADGNYAAVVDVDGSDARPITNEGSFTSPEWSPDGDWIALIGPNGVMTAAPEGDDGPSLVAAGEAFSLSWSPDSSRLAFDSFRESKSESRHVVVVLDLASEKETVLSGEQQGAQAPEWSPEGDQIAFLSMRLRAAHPSTSATSHCGGEPYETHLWSMRADGTKAHQLAEAELYGRPSWGRASEALSEPAPMADQQPAPASLAQQKPTRASDVPTPSSDPPSKPAPTSRPTPAPIEKTDLPPAAKGLIAVRGSNAIYLVDADSAATSKVPHTAAMIAPSWSPDESLLAVERVEKDGSSSIYTISPNGSHPQLVLPNASSPSWSAAGDRIFAARNECTAACEPEDDDANVLYAVNLDGSNVQRVDFEEADVWDGRELAWPTDGSAIHFFDEESLSGAGSFDSSAATWSPDGAQLVFVGSTGPTDEADTGKTGLWIVSADGGRPNLLLSGASGRPSWVSS